MPVDPTDPETFEDDDAVVVEITEDVEAPVADAAEQRADLAPRRDERPAVRDTDEADEADRAEQARVVELNEDDYR
ncbi:hypothetical protein BLA24_25235 [Streptomyces cinnamoneus]|uniref:DUF5709 domain-containing protein n=1 Tax=Streptomyces cinnamoneus TaxID=53446 RepID=A0A2G1XDP3_STRCJ|nr:hypothetical protein [Streptomyces cinnamoneus]PHQ49357.1 hypothetical protein BLA24_25235 [Streptomyces cinnamoneus]PPT14995.1 hypothetical protein CYQ11_20835 [Streptomyces cinnamoneus]